VFSADGGRPKHAEVITKGQVRDNTHDLHKPSY
jgi:hypothetical protein